MARKRGTGRFRRYLRGNVDERISFGGLGALGLNKQNFDSVVNERTYVSSIRATWTLDGYTPTQNAGPIVCGVCHSDYSAAEVLAWFTATGSWNETDLIAKEVANRKIRIVGTFPTPDAATDAVVLNDGKAILTKLGWILSQGQTLAQWVYNSGSQSVAITTPDVRATGHANLWPK